MFAGRGTAEPGGEAVCADLRAATARVSLGQALSPSLHSWYEVDGKDKLCFTRQLVKHIHPALWPVGPTHE